MLHRMLIVAEIREVVARTEWAEHEATGRACVVCPCGLNTGFIDKAAATEAYRKHIPNGQRISITIGGDDQQMRDMVRQIVHGDS